MPTQPNDYDNMLKDLQWQTFAYFLNETNPVNGLVADKTRSEWPASIAATGLALSSYPIGVERGFLSRMQAIKTTLATLRFFHKSEQSSNPEATGYKGFYYHFLDMENGRRAWKSELSTVDSALLLAGALTAAIYFDHDSADEQEIRELADLLYRRADWRWAQNGSATVTHGWKPECGFLKYRWCGYDEALILYVLGLGSPTYPLPEECYTAWAASYSWKEIYGHEVLYAGPLFIHQLSHIWIDFRDIKDKSMRERGIDYFENSRRATLIQQLYSMRNPNQFAGYSAKCWGITASDGPGPDTIKINGVERRFFDYLARVSLMVRMMELWRLGPWLRRFPLRRRSFYPRCVTSLTTSIWSRTRTMVSRRALIRHIRRSQEAQMDGFRPGTTGSIRDQSF